MAGPVRVSLVLKHNGIKPLAAALQPRASIILRKTASDIANGASARTHRVDTGAMKNGFRNEARGPLTEVVFNTQDYFVYHELGTIYISAAPMLKPAAEAARRPFEMAFAQLFASAT